MHITIAFFMLRINIINSLISFLFLIYRILMNRNQVKQYFSNGKIVNLGFPITCLTCKYKIQFQILLCHFFFCLVSFFNAHNQRSIVSNATSH